MDDARHFETHDPRLISILEVFGAYFVDYYFNHIYASAKTSMKARSSLNDEYAQSVVSYILAVQESDRAHYRKVLAGLHAYYRTETVHATMTYAEFVNHIVQQFVPAPYSDLLSAQEKDETLADIVIILTSKLGSYATTPAMLRVIVGEHDVKFASTIRSLQNMSLTILLAKRAEVHNNYLRKAGQVKDTVSGGALDDLKDVIRALVKAKAEMAAEVSEAAERIQELEGSLDALRVKDGKYRKLILMMQTEREQGRLAAAFGAAVPQAETRAEVSPQARRAAPPAELRAELVPLAPLAAGRAAPPAVERIAEFDGEGGRAEYDGEEGRAEYAGEEDELPPHRRRAQPTSIMSYAAAPPVSQSPDLSPEESQSGSVGGDDETDSE
jgi:hypothetical protein